jgi:NAD-dependent deacetylase
MKKHLVVLTGAGVSAESGLRTFRDNNGLWEEYSVYEVATPQAWNSNPELVLEFYNQRRKQLLEVLPNAAHKILANLEDRFIVSIITQNIDDLHERAGSSNVLHLHGELKKARSTINSDYVVTINGWELKKGEKCPQGGQLRPHVVWFGEDVPMMYQAAEITASADILLVVGTSLNVYPAAGLVDIVPKSTPIYVVDPSDVAVTNNAVHIKQPATKGMVELKERLIKLYSNK